MTRSCRQQVSRLDVWPDGSSALTPGPALKRVTVTSGAVCATRSPCRLPGSKSLRTYSLTESERGTVVTRILRESGSHSIRLISYCARMGASETLLSSFLVVSQTQRLAWPPGARSERN